MNTKILLISILLIAVLCGCSKVTDDKYSTYFESSKSIDLSDVLKVYEENKSAEEDSIDYDLGKALEGSAVEYFAGIELSDNTDFAIKLPQYANSKNPFLSQAEVFYNSCVLAFNVWSDYEMWEQEMVGAKETCLAIQGIGNSSIENPTIRNAAQMYKDSIVWMIRTPVEQWDCIPRELLDLYSKEIEAHAYKFYMDEKSFVDSLDALTAELAGKTKSQFDLYKQSDAEKRLELMLHLLNDCRSFDEQCSLLLNWANCDDSKIEDPWIVAVAGRFLKADKYNPCLNKIWMVWRCLFQSEYYGISRKSSIPNKYYNEMRKRCYLTCLKRIETHPDDVFAMNCAAAIGGRENITRFGEFPFGNDAPSEEYQCMPNRYVDKEEGDDCNS